MRAPVRQQSSVGSQIPISTCETLRNRGVALLSRLLWYDKKQFRQFLANLVESRDLTFLMPFLHGYLTFCGDPQNPFSTVVTSTSAASTGGSGAGLGGGHSNSKLYCFLFMRGPYLCTVPFKIHFESIFGIFLGQTCRLSHLQLQRRQNIVSICVLRTIVHKYGKAKAKAKMGFCTTILSLGTTKNPSKNLGGQQSSNPNSQANSKQTGLSDLGSKYANNFKNDEMTSIVNIEALFINAMFKKLVSKMTDKLAWLKASDNSALYNDCRGFINHVKINYGSIFRRVALSGLMDSTKKLVKTQYKVDAGHHLTRLDQISL